MSSKTPQTVAEAIAKLVHVRARTNLSIKRTLDNWAFKQIWADKKRGYLINAQKFNLSAHVDIGPDLSASKFVISRCGGSVRNEHGKWIGRVRDLPPDYSKSFHCTAVNASRSGLLTEGIDNFAGLEHLQSLDLSENPELDDFACDQLGRQFRTSKALTEINLSENPRISIYGLEVLFRIPSIKKIVAIGTAAAEHEEIDLFTLAAEDERSCEVYVHKDGSRYKLPELEELRRSSPDEPKRLSATQY